MNLKDYCNKTFTCKSAERNCIEKQTILIMYQIEPILKNKDKLKIKMYGSVMF
jgi:hypothetical protein